MRIAPLFLLLLCACTAAPSSRLEAPQRVTIGWISETPLIDGAYASPTEVELLVQTFEGDTVTDSRSIDVGEYESCGIQSIPEADALLTLTCEDTGNVHELRVRIQRNDTLVIEQRAAGGQTFESMKEVHIPVGAIVTPILRDGFKKG